ncbi:ribonuclease H-like domain-containing protein [Tanacetum coccineum]
MDTGASSYLYFNASNLSTIFDKRLLSSVHVGDGKSIPVTNTDHIIIPSHHRPIHLHNVLDYLTRHILFRCDSSGDLYPVTKPSTYHIAFLSTSASTWHQRLEHPGVDFDETFSPVVKPAIVRTVLILAVSRKWPIHQLDVKNAFLNGDLSETVYMHQPPGYVTRAEFYHSRCDSSLFIYRQGSQVAYLLIYVDGIILTASCPALLQQIISSLNKEFDMTDLGALNYFLGISVDCTPTESKLGPEGVLVQDLTLYRSLAGGLQYLTFTRPDMSYAVQQICLYMHNPRESHFAALKRCPSARRSTSSYCVFMGDNLLSWSAKRQHTISRSSAEAEYRGVANVVAETAWVRNLLRKLQSPLMTATLVYCDNVSAVYMSANPVQHQRMKHIEINIHFVHDMVTAGHVRVLHVPSRFQFADIFTKGLPSALFEDFRSSLSVRPPPL